MQRVLPGLFGALVILFAGGVEAARAQATAQINGTVVDESGAILPGATVVAIQTETRSIGSGGVK